MRTEGYRRDEIGPPNQISLKLINKNAIKPWKECPPKEFPPKALTLPHPLGDLGKNWSFQSPHSPPGPPPPLDFIYVLDESTG
jgi:hypothetical protein